MNETRVTDDSLFGGRLKLSQPARGSGYRANVDAILLAAFAHRKGARAKLALDLGAGAGAVGLSILYLGAAERMVFVEQNQRLAGLCSSNVLANQFGDRARVMAGVVAASLTAIDPSLLHACDLVVANPPYFSSSKGGQVPLAPDDRARARHGELLPFLRAAAEALGRRGRACVVYPSEALLDLMSEARKLRLEPKRLRLVHGKAGRPARIALLEMVSGKPGGLVVEPPLIETQLDGARSDELDELLGRGGSPSATIPPD
jgi:tRNA1Val (adenine37-N6)-methyltransferase